GLSVVVGVGAVPYSDAGVGAGADPLGEGQVFERRVGDAAQVKHRRDAGGLPAEHEVGDLHVVDAAGRVACLEGGVIAGPDDAGGLLASSDDLDAGGEGDCS